MTTDNLDDILDEAISLIQENSGPVHPRDISSAMVVNIGNVIMSLQTNNREYAGEDLAMLVIHAFDLARVAGIDIVAHLRGEVETLREGYKTAAASNG